MSDKRYFGNYVDLPEGYRDMPYHDYLEWLSEYLDTIPLDEAPENQKEKVQFIRDKVPQNWLEHYMNGIGMTAFWDCYDDMYLDFVDAGQNYKEARNQFYEYLITENDGTGGFDDFEEEDLEGYELPEEFDEDGRQELYIELSKEPFSGIYNTAKDLHERLTQGGLTSYDLLNIPADFGYRFILAYALRDVRDKSTRLQLLGCFFAGNYEESGK